MRKSLDKGEGPTLIEFKTYRVEGHCRVIRDLPIFRPKDVVEYWAEHDPIKIYSERLVAQGVLTEEEIARMPEASVELIDLRTIVPMDFETVLNSVKKTGRILVVHEATAGFSIGSEIVRRVVQEGFDYLDAEPLVLGNLRSVAPFAGNLEDAVMLTPDDVLEKMRYLLTGVL